MPITCRTIQCIYHEHGKCVFNNISIDADAICDSSTFITLPPECEAELRRKALQEKYPEGRPKERNGIQCEETLCLYWQDNHCELCELPTIGPEKSCRSSRYMEIPIDILTKLRRKTRLHYYIIDGIIRVNKRKFKKSIRKRPVPREKFRSRMRILRYVLGVLVPD